VEKSISFDEYCFVGHPFALRWHSMNLPAPSQRRAAPLSGRPFPAFLPLLLALLAVHASTLAPALGASDLRIEVDAHEISRRLLHTREEIPAHPGKLTLWFPKWLPGTHAPGGPIENVGGLYLDTPDGKPIPWRRDDAEPCRLECTVPTNVDHIVLRLDYICNQSSVSSRGADCFGDANLGVINWYTCFYYPEDASIDDLYASVHLTLPTNWLYATALTTTQQSGAAVEFKRLSLRHLVDCPLICGQYLRTIDLQPKNFPPSFMHLMAESPEALQLDDKVIAEYRNVASEAGALFGGAHFSEFHFLVTCSDSAGYNGLEHLSSSLNGVGERSLIDDKQRKGWVAELIPHEFVHSWCGKHRRPAGMVTTNLHTTERTSLLWVYEGLTEYLGHVLMVRSGLESTNDFLPQFALEVDSLIHTTGRRWRPLEDTAIASHLLRGGSKSWGRLRRSQDYYHEGELLWLEADTIIREQSGGQRSLDDFCKKFFGPDGKDDIIVPYERADVIEALNAVASYDWGTFIHDRVDVTQSNLPLSVIKRCGYHLEYSSQPPQLLKDAEHEGSAPDTFDSLGLTFSRDGTILGIVPEMPGDLARLATGMKVIGIDHRKFSPDRLRDAVAESVTKHTVDLLVLDGESFRTFTINYADGPKYIELVRDPSVPDLLSAILKPVVSP
jgi:predicted metalloprotease with PDZ domain